MEVSAINSKAFSLIELAIVLVIVGAVTAGAVKMVNSSYSSSKHSSSKNAVEAAVKQLREYAARAQKLPSVSDFPGTIADNKDSFGKNLNYVPDTGAVTPPVSGSVSSICALKDTDISVRLCSNASCSGSSQTFSNIAFFVASSGINENFQYSKSGNQITVFSQGVSVDGYSSDGSKTEGYDDITGWMNLDTLKSYIGCKGYGLEIVQDKLPSIIHENIYSYKLSLKGGVSPYQWCVESDDSVNVQTLTYDAGQTQNIKSLGGCTNSDYTTADSITIKSASAMNITDGDPSTALVRVLVKDSNGAASSKDYSIRIMKLGELAMTAKAAAASGEEEEEEAPEDGEGTETTGPFKGFRSTNGYLANLYENSLTFHESNETKAFRSKWLNYFFGNKVTKYKNYPACVWLDCNIPGSSSNVCPSFDKAKIAVYFEFTPRNFASSYSGNSNRMPPSGFTFAFIRSDRISYSYSNRTGYAFKKVTTANDCGGYYYGLGYSSYDNTSDVFSQQRKAPNAHIMGSSFAVEFDTLYVSGRDNSYKSDPSTPHMAVVSHKEGTYDFIDWANWLQYMGPYHYAYNKHNSGDNNSCSSTPGGGCYQNSSTYINDVKMSVRIEAFSNCKSDCSVCGSSSAGNNYVCVYSWKSKTSDLGATALANMQDTSKFYKYPGSGLTSDFGNPLVMDSFSNPSTTSFNLDYIRYGFTIGTGSTDFDLVLENLKHKVVNN